MSVVAPGVNAHCEDEVLAGRVLLRLAYAALQRRDFAASARVQTNRVSAVRIAGERAGIFAVGAAYASDGFFPFADGLEAAVESGCSAVIAPEGSIRDTEVVAAADRLGIALVFSSHRYFLH